MSSKNCDWLLLYVHVMMFGLLSKRTFVIILYKKSFAKKNPLIFFVIY